MTRHATKGAAILYRHVMGALVAAVFLCLMGSAATNAVGLKEIDVDISPGHTKETNVGCGFGLITEWTVLGVDLYWPLSPIPIPVKSSGMLRPCNPDNVWVNTNNYQWWCVGVEPFDECWVVLWGVKGGGGGGGGGGPSKRWMSVSDCDLDADTDNNSVGWPRVPDESDDEDKIEYYDTPYATSTVPGIALGANDDHDEFLPGSDPWGRDLDNTTADLAKEGKNYKEDGDTGHSVGLAKLQLTVNAERDGQLDFDFSDTIVRLFESDGSAFQGARNLERGKHELTFWMECIEEDNYSPEVTVTFDPVGSPGVAKDAVTVTPVKMDIDVDSDNNGTIVDDNSQAEDLNEAKPGEPGMVVSLTEDPEEPPEGDPNGVLRGLYSMTISDVLDPHDPVVTLKKVTGEGNVQVWKVREGEDPVLMLDTSEEESTTTDGEGKSLWDLLADCSDHEVIIIGVDDGEVGVGEVQLGLELTVNGAKVAMDVVRVAVLGMESTEWLVTHDPEFEYWYCGSPGAWGHPEWAGRFKQAEVMANEAIVKLTKIATIQYEVKLLCNDEEVVTLDQTDPRYEERDGYAIFHFETDENQDGSADTNASGGIYVEDKWLERGVTSASVKYTFEVWANGVKVFSDREITIGPLVNRLEPNFDPWKPASLFSDGFSPYTKPPYNDDRWRDQPDRKMKAEDPEGEDLGWYFNYAYGMAIECEFTDDLESLGVKASGGDIAGERTYPVADAAMFLAKGVPKIIEWEGFDDDSEKIHEVPDLSSLSTPPAPVNVIKEADDYVLKIEAVREKDPSQKQRIELRDLKVDYGLEHVFEGVQE